MSRFEVDPDTGVNEPTEWTLCCHTCGYYLGPSDNRDWLAQKRDQHNASPWTGQVDNPYWGNS